MVAIDKDGDYYLKVLPYDERQAARIINTRDKADLLEEDWLEEWITGALSSEGLVYILDKEWVTSALEKSGAEEVNYVVNYFYKQYPNGRMGIEVSAKEKLTFKGKIDYVKLKKLIYN